jgi:hypothetical protein
MKVEYTQEKKSVGNMDKCFLIYYQLVQNRNPLSCWSGDITRRLELIDPGSFESHAQQF